MPSKRATSRKTMGKSIIRTANSAGGKIPEMIPTMTGGSLQTHANQPYVAQSEWMLLTAPMNATVLAR